MGFDETVFLTGFPGFIASRLVRQLAKAGARLLLLVQPSFLEQATKELDQIAVSEGRTRDSFRILPGDISEHHLGLTCDPVAGYVQVPCIERCAFGAVKAWTAFAIASNEIANRHRVGLDETIQALAQTAKEMNSKYKETSEAGLALSVALVDC